MRCHRGYGIPFLIGYEEWQKRRWSDVEQATGLDEMSFH